MNDTDRDCLIELMSLIFNRDDLYVSSRIGGEMIGFGGKLARVIPNRTEPFILVVTDYGMQFGVSFTDLTIQGPTIYSEVK